MKKANCSVSALVNVLVQKMWLETDVHTLGLHFHSRGGLKRMVLKYGGWLADDLCFCELGSCKGQQSCKPCPCCLNIVGRCDPATLRGHGYKRHVHTCWDETEYQRATAEDYAEMCTRIESLHQMRAPKTETEKLEIACGIKYEPEGAMFNPRARALVRFPELVIWDWQHNICSSSGVGQYICNEICRQIDAQGVATLSQLDEFAASIQYPKNAAKLNRTFFQDRVQLHAGHHLKAFATIIVLGSTLIRYRRRQTSAPHMWIFLTSCARSQTFSNLAMRSVKGWMN